MALDAVDYVLIDGKRYAVDRDTFRRFTLAIDPPELKAKTPEAPFIDGEVIAFDGGLKSDDLDDQGNWYYDALGMEPTGPDGAAQKQLKVGKQLTVLGTPTAADGGYRSLLPFKGNLYAGVRKSGADPQPSIVKWNGTTWTTQYSPASGSGANQATVLVNCFGSLFFFRADTEDSADSVDGTTWNARDMTGVTGTGIESAAAVSRGTDQRLYAIIDEATGAGNPAQLVYVDAVGGTVWTSMATLRERFSAGAIVAVGVDLYFAGIDNTANANFATIYKLTNHTTPLSILAEVRDNYPVSAASFLGKTYWAMNSGGELYRHDGTNFELVKTFDFTGAFRVYVHKGVLYAAGESATTANRILIYAYNGTGWSQPHYVDAGATVSTINALSSYAGRLVVGLFGSVGDPTNQVREVSASSRQTAAQLEGPNAVYGLPGARKPYILCRLQHSAILSGQTVQLRHKLDDGAEVTDGTNSNVNDTQTILALPVETIGARLRPRWYVTNGAAQDFTAYSMDVRALPPIGERAVWEADLRLLQQIGGSWNDAVADSLTEFQKLNVLQELRRTGRYFQAVDPYRDGSQPLAAMQAVFDPQVPLKGRLTELANGADIIVGVRLLQALGDVNGLLDPSFEENAVGANPNAAWTLIGTPTSAFVSTAVAAPVGSKVLAVIFGGAPGATAGRAQAVAVTAGRYYTVGGYIRRATSAGTVRINVTGTGLGVGTPSLVAATDTDFTYYEVVFQVPSGTTTINIRLIGEGTPAGTVYFDGVRLRE